MAVQFATIAVGASVELGTIKFYIADPANTIIIECLHPGYLLTSFKWNERENKMEVDRQPFETQNTSDEPDWAKLKELFESQIVEMGEHWKDTDKKELIIKVKAKRQSCP